MIRPHRCAPRTARFVTLALVGLLASVAPAAFAQPAAAGSTSPAAGAVRKPAAAPKAQTGAKPAGTAKPSAASKPAGPAKPSAASKPAAASATAVAPDTAPAPRPARRSGPSASDFAGRDDVRGFVREMVERHGFDETALLQVFGRTRPSETAARLMHPPPPGARRSWTTYRSRFVEPIRIREGLRFWRANADAVRRASERFGVPEEVIVSIIGVETIYGRQVGDFRVMEALSTLAFDYPRRAAFFREELEHYLLLARENGFDPLDWRGSFAGAIGLPQFMPGSIRRHAVDFDGDGRIDLRASAADAIGSVASFLANHGWIRGAPTHFPATLEDEARARPAVEAGIPPRLSPAELAALGVTSPQPLPADEPLSLIDLPDGEDPTRYVLGTTNFWVITRYNRSYFYAMAVIDLARALRADTPAPQASTAR